MSLNLSEITNIIKQAYKNYGSELDISQIGTVVQVNDGIAHVYGLTDAMSGELIEFDNNIYGMAMNLEADSVGVIIFGDTKKITEGSQAKLTGKVVEVPVGYSLLGRVVNALGEPIDDKGPIEFQ